MEWICGNGIAEIGEKKIVPIAEIEERDINKVRILFFQYFFDWTSLVCHVLLEIDKDRFKYTLWYIDFYFKVHAVNKNKKKYIDSYRRKKNDWWL